MFIQIERIYNVKKYVLVKIDNIVNKKEAKVLTDIYLDRNNIKAEYS